MKTVKFVMLGILFFPLFSCTQKYNDAENLDPIVIGDISTYGGFEKFTLPYKNGWALAVEEINAEGGISGRSIVVISRDDESKSDKAVAFALELKEKHEVDVLFGTAMFGIGNLLSEFAEKEELVFIASLPMDDKILSSGMRKYTYRLRPSSRMQASMLAHEAAKLPSKRWATVAPNYAFGWDAVSSFKSKLTALRPDVVFVEEIWPERFKFDSETIVSELVASNPDAVFNATFGPDLGKFVETAVDVNFFENKNIVSMLAGEPEYSDSLKPEALQADWLVSGYPWHNPQSESHKEFVDRYTERYGVPPLMAALNGYMTMKVIGAGLRYADQNNIDNLTDAFTKITINTPAGEISFRDKDHQSTLGTWIGWLGKSDQGITMKNYSYVDGQGFMPVYEAPSSN